MNPFLTFNNLYQEEIDMAISRSNIKQQITKPPQKKKTKKKVKRK